MSVQLKVIVAIAFAAMLIFVVNEIFRDTPDDDEPEGGSCAGCNRDVDSDLVYCRDCARELLGRGHD